MGTPEARPEAAGVAPRRTCFTAETGGERRVIKGQLRAIENFARVIIRHRDLGGGNEAIIGAFHMEHIFGEFGQLACACEGLGVGHIRRQQFGEAIVFVLIKAIADDGAL